jgi:uncharacterized lipoprotein YddW (UPF0748 family)
MRKVKRQFIGLLLVVLLLPHFVLSNDIEREFRGMWIATVNNLDWPSRTGLTVDEQKSELLKIINTLHGLHFNAVIFQVRPAGDAFYRSSTEPWSYWLSGEQGRAPAQNWDPLQFLVDECHKRGIELHAWMNPFRLSMNLNSEFSPRSVALRHPEWVLTYGNKHYLDPGIPAVRTYLNNVVAELVRKYDIDAIHFDDYFYPYPIAGKTFPDTLSFKTYNRGFANHELENWRRQNVDLIIESLNKTIKSIKPKVKFGISPFGVWKNYDEGDEISGSATSAGNTNYHNLYADVINWQRKGWIDYMIPQIYWEIGHPQVDYITLVNWWGEQSFGRHVYVGHALYKLAEGKTTAWVNPDELPEQVLIARRNKSITGSAFFRMQHLNLNPKDFKNRIDDEIYQTQALLPTMYWLDSIPPQNPHKIKTKGLFRKEHLFVKYTKKQAQSPDHLGYLVFYSDNKQPPEFNNPANIRYFFNENFLDMSAVDNLPVNKKGYLWLVAIDKHHNKGRAVGPVKIKIKP